MLSVFLLQLAGGSMLAIGLTRIDDMSWRYLRLVAIVSIVALGLNSAFSIWGLGSSMAIVSPTCIPIDPSVLIALIWIVLNARQRERIRVTQRIAAGMAGLSALTGAFFVLADSLPRHSTFDWNERALAALPGLLIGGVLIGAVTDAMLLGHRYLTDTGMTIAPLRRLTNLFIGATAIRALSIPAGFLFGESLPTYEPEWTWVLLCLAVRIGVGILGTAVFAYMVWDCVRRRSTQSATGILYLTMVFVFIGELTAQYLLRWKGLAV